MRKFYKFTKSTGEERVKELEEFVDKYNSKYSSYKAVKEWLAMLNRFYILDKDGFEFDDPDISKEEYNWGHGSLVKYSPSHHIIVNDNIDLGKL